jgi:glutathione S-transferase
VKRVPNHQFLYIHGRTYYFRRAVPPDAREAFENHPEHKVSLRTRELAEARHLADKHLKDFDRRVSRALGRPDPTARVTPEPFEPAPAEIDAAVRRWLEEREVENPILDYSAPQRAADGLDRLGDLGQFTKAVEGSLKLGAGGPGLLTEWTAEEIVRRNGWRLVKQSTAYRRLLRTVSRAQLEHAHRERAEINGEPRSVIDATFAPEQYRLDAERGDRPRYPRAPLMALFDAYVAEAQPSPASVKAWKPCLLHFARHLGHDDAARVTTADVIRWKEKLVSEPIKSGAPRSPKTINDTYLTALKIVLKWAAENQRIPSHPAAGVRIRVPKKAREREKGLTTEEALTILKAAVGSSSSRLTKEAALARRWVPWICAYTGARVNEITQARAEDVRQRDGVWCIHITPEAGSVKSPQSRRWVAALNSIEMVTVPWWFLKISGDVDNALAGWMGQRLDQLEAVLKAREWLAADRFTVADLLMADVLRVPEVRAFGERPASEAYVARATDRPAFKKAQADQIALFQAADETRLENEAD